METGLFSNVYTLKVVSVLFCFLFLSGQTAKTQHKFAVFMQKHGVNRPGMSLCTTLNRTSVNVDGLHQSPVWKVSTSLLGNHGDMNLHHILNAYLIITGFSVFCVFRKKWFFCQFIPSIIFIINDFSVTNREAAQARHHKWILQHASMCCWSHKTVRNMSVIHVSVKHTGSSHVFLNERNVEMTSCVSCCGETFSLELPRLSACALFQGNSWLAMIKTKPH